MGDVELAPDGSNDDACAGSAERGAAAIPAASRQARNREAVFLYRRRMSGAFCWLKILSSFFCDGYQIR